MANVSTSSNSTQDSQVTGTASSTPSSSMYTSLSTGPLVWNLDPTMDLFVGTLLVSVFAVGLIGNVLALFYFRLPSNSTLPDKIYMAIVSVDILIVLSSASVILSLFSDRQQITFANHAFCCVWTMLNNILFRTSIFLVTILSLTRSIAIMMPHRAKDIRMRNIVLSIVCYVTVNLTIDGTAFEKGWLSGEYIPQFSYCTSILTSTTPLWAKRLYEILIKVEMILPLIIVFISFVVSSTILLKNGRIESRNETKRQRASVTITLFTALFLLCNVPVFFFQMAWLLESIPAVRTTLDFSLLNGNYGGLMFQYFPYVLNAGLNPCMYLLRMPRFQRQTTCWIRTLSRNVSFKRSFDVPV